MASVVDPGANKIKTNDGKVVVAQQGGWYDGQQYWGGTLSAAGVINSKSDQVGAGKAVSNEVIAQTNPNNVAYIQQQQQAAPRNTNEVTSYLNGFQSNLFNSVSGPEVRGVQSAEEIAAGLKSSGMLPGGTAPTPPSLSAQYQQLADAKGVDAISASITQLKADQDAIASQLQVTKTAEKGKPVAQNVIEGRVSQEEQTAQDQYDFIGRQLSRKTDELNSTLSNIQTIMQFTQADYQNASAAYNTQFDQAISTINLVRGIQQDQKDDVQRAQDNARANLQIMTNAITNGNLSLSSVGPEQQAQINKLEVQSGLPIGFMQSLQIDPGKNVLYTGKAENGQIQVLMRNQDGSMAMQTYGEASAKGGTTASTNALKADVASKMTLDQVMKKYGGSMSPDVILATYNAGSPWGKAKESLATLQKKYNVSGGTASKLPSGDQANIKTIKDDIAQGEYTRADAVKMFPEYAQYL